MKFLKPPCLPVRKKGGEHLYRPAALSRTLVGFRTWNPAQGKISFNASGYKRRDGNMHRKKKILVIDDDRLATSSMQALLEKERYRVEVINDGDQALQTLSWKKFDLIISDLVMKQMHGLGILAKVKEISAETPVIIITGYVSVKSAI